MERIKDLVKGYLLVTIQTKHNMRKQIYKLEEELKEANENLRDVIAQKNRYKEQVKKLKNRKEK